MKKKTARGGSVARPSVVAEDEILTEYSFRGARRNPYAARFRAGVIVVALDPDVAKSFPDSVSVNDALRALAKIARRQPRKRSSPSRSA
jgi:hypothetical protein